MITLLECTPLYAMADGPICLLDWELRNNVGGHDRSSRRLVGNLGPLVGWWQMRVIQCKVQT